MRSAAPLLAAGLCGAAMLWAAPGDAQSQPATPPAGSRQASPPPARVDVPVPRPATPMTYEAYRAETFIAAQNAVISEAADALNQVSARFAAGSGEVARLAARREELANRLAANGKRLDELYKAGAAGETSEARAARTASIDALQAEAQSLSRDLRALNDEIARRFPSYAELTRPQALEVAEVQRLLAPDEALVFLLTARDATYIWAVTREGVDWARATDFGREALGDAVRKLRANLTNEDARGAFTSRTTAAQRAQPAASASAAFDRALAHRLYLSLIKPVEGRIAGKRVVMSVVNGPLGALPLQVLVTAPPQGANDDPSAMATTPWLADRFALASLPTVSSLRAIRCFLPGRAGARPDACPPMPDGGGAEAPQDRSGGLAFVGFGDPTLGGSPAANRGAPQFQTAFASNRLANPEALRALPALPGTARELRGLASRFGRQAQVALGAQATEAAVRASADLPRARYVVFATHGLLAGQSGVSGEPGLVFTPPAQASEEDDGLLTASEAAQMRLRADFVVLSACNTASADGTPGGDGLSGLARAFFHAGAPAVLASHWEVSDAATAALMMEVFANMDRRDVRGRAEALQRAQASLRRTGRPEWVHPTYWAAFTLAGDVR